MSKELPGYGTCKKYSFYCTADNNAREDSVVKNILDNIAIKSGVKKDRVEDVFIYAK